MPSRTEICELLRDCPTMPATVIAERIELGSTASPSCGTGWPSSGPCSGRPIPASAPTTCPASWSSSTCGSPTTRSRSASARPTSSGWSPRSAGYSRFMAAHMVPPGPGTTCWPGCCPASSRSGHPPHRGLGRRGLHRPVATGQAGLHRGVPALPGDPRHGCPAVQAQRPRGQGHERTGQRLLRDLLPPRTQLLRRRRTSTPSCTTWLKRANRRVHATIRMVPAELIYEDRGSMSPFPPVLPDPA